MTVGRTDGVRRARSAWSRLYWWPVRRADQGLFAEALSQALAAGLGSDRAIVVAAVVPRSPWFRAALREMAFNYGAGYTLSVSLSRTGVRVKDELLAALTVGEDLGGLPDALTAFARHCHPRPAERVAAAVGRPPEVARFAAALARLLWDRPLTVELIEVAGRMAGGDGSAFAAAANRVAEGLRNGEILPRALANEGDVFDPLFVSLVTAPAGRDGVRAVLARLGEVPAAGPVAPAATARL